MHWEKGSLSVLAFADVTVPDVLKDDSDVLFFLTHCVAWKSASVSVAVLFFSVSFCVSGIQVWPFAVFSTDNLRHKKRSISALKRLHQTVSDAAFMACCIMLIGEKTVLYSQSTHRCTIIWHYASFMKHEHNFVFVKYISNNCHLLKNNNNNSY